VVEVVWKSRVGRGRWEGRMAICRGCPVFDGGLERCGPYDGAEAGCHCFTPYLGLVERPYPGGCWGREFAPGSGIGWE
jgi:hypothetical protein